LSGFAGGVHRGEHSDDRGGGRVHGLPGFGGLAQLRVHGHGRQSLCLDAAPRAARGSQQILHPQSATIVSDQRAVIRGK